LPIKGVLKQIERNNNNRLAASAPGWALDLPLLCRLRAWLLFLVFGVGLVGSAQATEPNRIASIRSIQFERRQIGIEMVLVLRMAQATDVPPPNFQLAGQLRFQSGIVGIAQESSGDRSVQSRTQSWRELGKFKARRSASGDAHPNELVVRTIGLHTTDRLIQLMGAATEAYAPYSRLQLRLDGQIQPVRRVFGFRRSDPTTPTSLGRWSALFVASAPKNPDNEIFKSPDHFGGVGEAVDATTAKVNGHHNKQR
jgi:hypothetical protein